METEQKGKKSIFENPMLSTKVKSSKVSIFPEGGLGYFIGPVLAILSNSILSAYLNRFWTDVLGLTSTTWGTVFSILLPVLSVALVVLGNIVVGKLMDKAKTRAGKARPLLLVSLPLIAIALIVIFFAPQPLSGATDPTSGDIWTLIWVAIGYNLYFSVAYPFYYTSHSALVTLSTRNSKDRSLLATISNATALAAMGLTTMIMPFFLGLLFVDNGAGGVDAAASMTAWKVVTIALIVITVLGILVEYYFTRERITEESFAFVDRDEKVEVKPVKTKDQAKAVLKDKFWWIIIVFFFLYQFGGMLKNCSQLYYCISWFPGENGAYSVVAGGAWSGTLAIIGAIPTALGMVIVWPLANKIGKGRSILFGAILSTIGGLLGFIAPDNFYLVATSFAIKALGSTPAMYISLALLSDVLDHNEAKNGFRSDGLTMTIYGAIMVGMSGLANGIINGVLGACGYDAANPLTLITPELRTSMEVLFIGGETICYAAILIIMLFMNVEKHNPEDRRIILERQKAECLASGKEWIEPEERMRLEEIEQERLAEENRVKELKAKCEKKGLDFEEEERKYQEAKALKEAKRKRKLEEKKAKQEAKKAAKENKDQE